MQVMGFLYALNLSVTAIADALVYLKRNEALHTWVKTLGKRTLRRRVAGPVIVITGAKR